MPRANHAVASLRRRKKVLKAAKGQRGGRSKRFRTAKESVQKGQTYSFRDRRAKKRTQRGLWITRLSAACKGQGISYSRFMAGVKKANINLNRKTLSELAIHDAEAFGKIVDRVKA